MSELKRTETLTRKATNLSLDQGLLEEAREYGVNISRAAESGLQQAVSKMKAKQWKRDNAEALKSSNDWVEKHGLPLDKFRQF